MPTFSERVEINATPDEVWAVLGDIASVDRWIPGVTEVTVDAMTRVCTFEDGHTQNEQILNYSPSARSYRYQIYGAPLPVTDNIGSFAVHRGDSSTVVVWESSFQPLDSATADQLAQIWQPFLPIVLGNLKNLIES